MSNTNNSEQPEILLVEDDRIVSTLVEHLLARQGYHVNTLADGRAAAGFISANSPPKLVLLDVMLPFIDGFELIEQIRALREWEDVPIVMLTSKTQERNVVRALEAGADDYIVKPFQPQELIARVKRLAKK